MKPASSFGFFVLIAALVIAAGAGLGSQWQQTMALRTKLELLRLDASELEQLRLANKQLREKQISAAELEVLRADHAALPRLRAEIEEMKKRPATLSP